MEFNEIGSNFSINIIPSKINNQNFNNTKSKFYLDTGRSALRLLLDNINVENKIVLLPYYICKVVIEPFIERNYKIYYYDINLDFSVNEESILSIINEIKPSIILINSYFGKEQLTDIKQKLKLTNIYIIEDITHTMLNNNLDIASSDFIIGSIRKWCAIPDGGFLINNTNLNINFNITKVNTEYVDLQLKAALLKDKYIKNVESSIKEKYMFLFKKSKEMLDNDGFIYSMSNESKTLMNNYDFETIKKIRKQNYNFLYENLVSCKFIKLPLGKLDTNEVPLYFPIFISKKRNEFQKYMSNLNIFLPIIWPKCELLPSNEYIANKIYDEIICIPCDQRYNLNDMKRIVTAIKEFERSEKNESIT